MRSRVRLFIAFSTVGVGAIATTAAAPRRVPSVAARGDSADVAAVVGDFHKALSMGDSARALGLLSDDAIVLESGGLESRSEYRSHHLPEDIKFARAVPSKRGPPQIRIKGSTAWTSGTSTTQGTFNGRPINSVGAESMVLPRENGGWRIRSIHWSSRNRRPPT